MKWYKISDVSLIRVHDRVRFRSSTGVTYGHIDSNVKYVTQIKGSDFNTFAEKDILTEYKDVEVHLSEDVYDERRQFNLLKIKRTSNPVKMSQEESELIGILL